MTEPAVAILTWRSETISRRCLASLLVPGGWAGPTVVVDNGSGTGEGDRLGVEFGIESVTLPDNGGVPTGYNAALRWARGRGASHLLLANNDVEFTDPGIVTRLARLATDDVAAAGPVIFTRAGVTWSAGARVRKSLGHVERLRNPPRSQPYAVDALDGACLVVNVEAACAIRGLEPEFFLYWEETDWCERARNAGYRLLVDPNCAITHLGGGSGDLRQTRRYALRNSLLFIRRNRRGLTGAASTMAWLLGRLPLFVVRRVREGASLRSAFADARWAVTYHLGDIRRRGWWLRADGPDVCS